MGAEIGVTPMGGPRVAGRSSLSCSQIPPLEVTDKTYPNPRPSPHHRRAPSTRPTVFIQIISIRRQPGPDPHSATAAVNLKHTEIHTSHRPQTSDTQVITVHSRSQLPVRSDMDESPATHLAPNSLSPHTHNRRNTRNTRGASHAPHAPNSPHTRNRAMSSIGPHARIGRHVSHSRNTSLSPIASHGSETSHAH